MKSITSTKSPKQDTNQPKFIAFPLANHTIALPIASVLRVLRHDASANNDELNRMGLFQIGRHVIRVLDLHQWIEASEAQDATHRLSPSSPPSPSSPLSPSTPYLIIARSPVQEPFGIWTDGIPDVIEFAADRLRSLPPSDGGTVGLLKLMSHAAIISQGKDTRTIFILDTTRALKPPAPARTQPAQYQFE